jgi:hypothetical protein
MTMSVPSAEYTAGTGYPLLAHDAHHFGLGRNVAAVAIAP